MTDEAAPRLPPHGHEPVLAGEVLAMLDPKPGEVAVDCTLGRGGHASLVAERLGSGGMLIGLDADPRNLAYAADRLAAVACPTRLSHANFGDLPRVLEAHEVRGVDVLLADLGVSTNQLLDAGYGLGMGDPWADLDMRLDPTRGPTAADLLALWDEKRIADTIYDYAQERFSRRIAREIVARRRTSPVRTTGELADLVRRLVPRARPTGGRRRPASRSTIDPATRTFQALRMAVNREPQALDALLASLPAVVRPGGRAAVISFHSGEDRAVKQALRAGLTRGDWTLPVRKPVTPGEVEVAANPRARSAKLRVLVRT